MTSEPNKLASFILYCLEKSLGKTCSARFCSHHQTSVPVKLASSKVDIVELGVGEVGLVKQHAVQHCVGEVSACAGTEKSDAKTRGQASKDKSLHNAHQRQDIVVAGKL